MSWDDQIKGQKEAIVEDIAKTIQQDYPHLFGAGGALDHDSVRQIIERHVMSRKDLLPEEKAEVKHRLLGQATQYGPLQELFVGPGAQEITEIMINPSSDKIPKVFVGIHGRQVYKGNHYFASDRDLKNFAQKICEDAGREFTESKPFVDAWMNDGSRVSVFGYKVSPLGTAMTIRKSPLMRPVMPLSALVDNGSMPNLAADLLVRAIIKGRASFCVLGRTDSGKTTAVRSIMYYVNPEDRVMIGEVSFELALPHLPNCINLVEVGFGDQRIVTTADIVLIFMRNNPDWAVLGEMRGGEIVAGSEMAASTSGFVSTGHANGLDEFRSRLPKMYARGGMNLPYDRVDSEIRTMFNFLLFFDKAWDGSRLLMKMVEVEDQYRTIMRFDEDEFAATEGRVKRWVYENPVTQKRLSSLAFRGKAKILPEFESVKSEYLYAEKGWEI